MANLGVKFCGLQFKNPMIVASIEPTNSPVQIKRCIDNGAAGCITKTLADAKDMTVLTNNSRYAILNDRGDIIKGKVPRNFTFYSRSGYSTTYYKDWVPYLKELQAYAAERNAHIIGSVGSRTLKGWVDISRTIEDCGIPMVELNFGCPHPAQMAGGGGGSLIGQDLKLAAEITHNVVEALDIPVIIKLTPDQSRPLELARTCVEAGASAVTATNRYTGFAIDIETGEPRIGGTAGIGGPWVKPLTLRWVHEIYSKLGIPITGSNGIFDSRDAVEFLMSGARLMQIGSVLMLKGQKWLLKVLEDLSEFMDDHGYADIESMIGVGSRKAAKNYQELFQRPRHHAQIDVEACQNPSCDVCIQMCFYEALSQGEGKVKLHPQNCIGCELCYNVCPFDSVKIVPTSESQFGRVTLRLRRKVSSTISITRSEIGLPSVSRYFPFRAGVESTGKGEERNHNGRQQAASRVLYSQHERGMGNPSRLSGRHPTEDTVWNPRY